VFITPRRVQFLCVGGSFFRGNFVVFVAVGGSSEVVVVVGRVFSPSSLFAVVVGLLGASLLSPTCLQYAAATSFD